MPNQKTNTPARTLAPAPWELSLIAWLVIAAQVRDLRIVQLERQCATLAREVDGRWRKADRAQRKAA